MHLHESQELKELNQTELDYPLALAGWILRILTLII